MISDPSSSVPGKPPPKGRPKGAKNKVKEVLVRHVTLNPGAAKSAEQRSVVVAKPPVQDVEVVPFSSSDMVKEGAAWHATARATLQRTAQRLSETDVPTRINDLRTWTNVVAEHVKTGMLLYGIGNGDQQASVSGGISGSRRVLDAEVVDIPVKELAEPA